jgi:hypothetical protein
LKEVAAYFKKSDLKKMELQARNFIGSQTVVPLRRPFSEAEN